MFTYLKVKNFALIEDVEIEFHTGFTAFVGETGAGKSLLIDAINLLSGARSSISFIKKGAPAAEIEGTFYLPATHKVFLLLQQLDVVVETGEELFVSRKIMQDGRSISKIQGKNVPTQMLKKLMVQLVDIHGQHESSYLLRAKNHLHLLDIYGQAQPLLSSYRQIYQRYQQLQQHKTKLYDVATELDMLPIYEKQYEELIHENITPDVIANTKEQFSMLKDIGRYFSELVEVQALFQQGVLGDNIYQIYKAFERKGDAKSDKISSIYYELQDIEQELQIEIEQLTSQKQQQQQIEDQMAQIFSLQKKYGEDLEEAKTTISEKINQLQNIEYDLIQIDKQLLDTELLLEQAAQKLHTHRCAQAQKLEAAIMQQLSDLYMEHVVFHIPITTTEYSEFGSDSVEYFIRTNIGTDLQPLIKIASGGELSRIMLAIKVVFAQSQTLSTIIFDEIDTGVSGKVAQAIAMKMQLFSKKQQVFAITHLPQVLAASEQQLFIEKTVVADQTLVSATYLDSETHVLEIAKMLSGTAVNESGLVHAKELIATFN